MTDVSSYFPAPHEDATPKEPFFGEVPCLKKSDRASLVEMPDSVLLKIISYLPSLTKSYSSRLEAKEAIKTFHSLSKVNQRLHEFLSENYTRAVFVKALLERFSLLRGMENGAFNTCLNLDLSALKLGFELYLKDQSNAFFKVDRLNQKINHLVSTFLNKAKEELKSASFLPSIEWLPAEPFCGSGKFTIYLSYKEVMVSTPLQLIRVKESFRGYGGSEEEENRTFLLLISYFLIKRLHATLDGFYDIGSTAWEFSRPDSSCKQIKKIADREIRAVTRKDLRDAMGSRRVILPLEGYTRYKIAIIGLWGENVLKTARFILENKEILPEWEMLHRIYFIIESFWGPGTHNNVIISLLEKGELKTLEEIHAFLVEEVIRLYEKEGKSKQKIVEEVGLPFTDQEHPMLSLCFRNTSNVAFVERQFLSEEGFILGEEGFIAKYQSGMSNQEIFEHYVQKRGILSRSDPSIYKWIGRYFWGRKGQIIVRESVTKVLGIEHACPTYKREEKPFWDRLILRFLDKGESRETILKDLGLPSALQIHILIKGRSFGTREDRDHLETLLLEKDFQVLFSMIEKSLS